MKDKVGVDTIIILVAIIITAILLIIALANKGEYGIILFILLRE